jgi:hypothetical protein
MTLAIRYAQSYYPLACAKIQNYHLKYPNVLRKLSYNVKKIPLKRVTFMLTNNIIMAINRCDTFKPVDI